MSIRDFFGFIGLWFKRILNIFSMGMCVFFSIAFFSDSYEKTVPLVLPKVNLDFFIKANKVV